MCNPLGFGSCFEVLFEQNTSSSPRLPPAFRQIYGGDWQPLIPEHRPYTCINFVTSRDGRISFNVPNHLGGGDVSGFHKADTWLMGLLRAGADAVLMGDGTLKAEPEHLWTSQYIFPAEAQAFTAMRQVLGLSEEPIHVFLSQTGVIEANAAVFRHQQAHVLVATTKSGKPIAQSLLRQAVAKTEVIEFGELAVDLEALLERLYHQYNVRVLLCEGGPRVYGSMLEARVLDEEFLTLSPLMLGATPQQPRPSLVEGVAFMPHNAPKSELISLRREGEHLFLRSKWHYPHQPSVGQP